MKSKLDLAHEYAMKCIEVQGHRPLQDLSSDAWRYADAMYEQLEKRESKGTPEAISNAHPVTP